MKIKIKLFISFIGVMFLLVTGTKVQAASASVSASSTNVKPGTKVTITTKINGAAWAISLNGAISERYSDATSDAEDTTKYEKTTFTPSKEGTYKITLSGNVTGSNDSKATNVSDSVTIVAKSEDTDNNNDNNDDDNDNDDEPSVSSNANLKNLGITPHDFTGFRRATTYYSVSVPNDTGKISIYASPSDSNATVYGTGSKSLDVGKNTFYITAVAEDKKTKKTYTLVVTREGKTESDSSSDNSSDNEPVVSSDATLRNLGVTPSKYDFTGFQKNTTSYETTVGNEVENIEIYAYPTNSKAQVSGIGNKKLDDGDNRFTIKVTAEDKKTTKAYYITVKRKEKTENDNKDEEDSKEDDNKDDQEDEKTTEKKDTGITDLSILGYKITPSFSPEIREYNVNITEIIKKVEVETKKSNDNIDIEITGNEDLKIGKNVITILVTDKNKKTTETYQIFVNINEEKIDVTKYNYEVKQAQAGLTKQSWITKGTIALIVILSLVFIIARKKIIENEDVETEENYIEVENPYRLSNNYEETIEEDNKTKRNRYEGRRFK